MCMICDATKTFDPTRHYEDDGHNHGYPQTLADGATENGASTPTAAVISGTKWGSSTQGTAGGTITWSFAAAGEDISAFSVGSGATSTTGDTFLTHDYEQTITDAFASWSSHGNIEFIQVEDQSGASGQQTVADIRIFFGAIPGGTIGYAYYPSSYGSAIAGDILIDTVSLLETNTSIFRGVMLHEIGHALGLEHATGETVMTSTISKTTLQTDDMNGIAQIYGAQDGAAPVHNFKTNQDDLNILEGLADLTVNGNARDNTIDGSDGAESIDGAGGNDLLLGQGGADALNGGSGDDILRGGAGADTLEGGSGFDIADYSEGASAIKLDMGLKPNGELGDALGDVLSGIEQIIGTAFDDMLLGESDKDWFYGGDGDDDMRGRASRDRLFGGEGEDQLNGGKGRDRLEGGSDSDKLWGMSGADILLGGQGQDTMDGGSGNDVLLGGLGNDQMTGGTGNDTMTGNTQDDRYFFSDGHGDDVITDFEALNALEKIDMSGISAINSMSDLTGGSGAASQSGADVLINTGGGNSILLENVNLGNLDTSDFLF